MLQWKRYFSQLKQDIKILNGENSRNWVANVVLNFHDDPTVKESFFWDRFDGLRKKEKILEKGEKKQNWEAEEAEESVWKMT